MTLQEMQTTVDSWIKKYGVRYYNEMTNTLLLVEEVGEFARLIARIYGEQSFKPGTQPTDPKHNLSDEIADIQFVLTCLANQIGIDLEAAVIQNLEKKTQRDKNRHQQNPKLG